MSNLWERIRELEGTECVFESAIDDLRRYRREERKAELPGPMCCLESTATPVVYATLSNDWQSRLDVPIWRAQANQDLSYMSARVFHCPFCGESLPEFQKKAAPPPHLHDGGDDYCGHCQERNIDCMCSFPESAWELANGESPKLYAATAYIWHPQEPLMLGVTRKDNHEDFGLPGGRIENGETPEECMIREVLEETGLVVKAAHLIFDTVDDHNHRVQVFRVTDFEGEIQTKEAGLAQWIPSKRLVDKTSSFRHFNKALFQRIGHVVRG